MVGVNTAIFSPTGGSVGIGFAIPAELASEVTQALIKDGRVSRGWLGVAIQDLTADMAEAQGLKNEEGSIIADVTTGSPAEKGGLQRGDVILSVNGQKVTDATTTTRLVGKLIANTANKFEVLRGGKRQTVNVTVGERPDDLSAAFRQAPDETPPKSQEEGTALDDMGVTFKPMDDETRTKLGLRSDEAGLVIVDVTRKGIFEDAGLQDGMVILEVNSQPATTVAAFEKAVAEAKKSGRSKVLVAVRIGQITNYRTLDLAAKG